MQDAGSGAPLAQLLPSWMLTLSERDLSPRTIEAYARTGDQFVRYLTDHDLPADTEVVYAPHIRAFLAAETRRTSAVSAHQHFRNLRVSTSLEMSITLGFDFSRRTCEKFKRLISRIGESRKSLTRSEA